MPMSDIPDDYRKRLTDVEYTRLMNTKSEQEWNDACDAVKAARGGRYPDDWYARMIASGAIDIAQTKWTR